MNRSPKNRCIFCGNHLTLTTNKKSFVVLNQNNSHLGFCCKPFCQDPSDYEQNTFNRRNR